MKRYGFANKLRECTGAKAQDRPFCVAEMSGNHGGDIEKAFAIIRAAKAAGADAVKFQTYEAHTITLDHDGPDFRIENPLWGGQRLYDLYKKAETPFAWHADLFACAKDVGIAAFSAPFDLTAVDLLEGLNAPYYKVASCELVDVGLIARVAQTGKPTIMSTGMATADEIEEAIAAFRGAGGKDLCLLHCISGYPTPYADFHLNTMPHLRSAYGVAVGLSDHSNGPVAAVVAAALGADVIEKHIMLGSEDGAVDAAFSLTPQGFGDMVSMVSDAASALGSVQMEPSAVEADTLRFRRSLYIAADMQAGDVFTEHNLKSVRPAGGLHTRHLPNVLGKKALRNLPCGTPLALADVSAD